VRDLDPARPGPATTAEREQAFAVVYETNGWGRSPSGARYYSDSPPEASAPYSRFVSTFIAAHDVETVVDLGCGDFEAARAIDFGRARYIGVDIYSELVAHNRELYGTDRCEFVQADIVEDQLPHAQLCLVALTLYIMSFADVYRVLEKLRQYELVLITDGQPQLDAAARRNIDKPTDKYTREDYFGNGFWLELEPFSLPIEVVHDYVLASGEHIRTVLWRPAASLR
jgi:SAM-dependent methyltransferase